MVTNEFERDLNDQAGLKRPGRVDFRVFQNTPDAGDGHPGLQRCFRNYLHEGGMEKDLDTHNYKIINLAEPTLENDGARKTDVDTVQTDLNTHKANDGSEHSFIDQSVIITASPTFSGLTINGNITITGNVDGVDVSIHDHSGAGQGGTILHSSTSGRTVDDHHPQSHALGSHTVPTVDISMNSKKITDLGAPTAYNDAVRFVDLMPYPIGDTVQHTNNDIGTTNNSTYTKIKEVISRINLKEFRVVWQHKCSVTATRVYSKVYINGVEKGVEKTTTSESYVTETDDISDDIQIGDLIQIWGYTVDGIGTCYTQNMDIRFDQFTNNDP